uniref:DNA topoisomerase n=1 Tax=viral metagenome TaxID=1070528 RepID=A0A6C0HW68_9ZZZZ
MPKYLVVVESPAKTKKIQGYLGSDYVVQASFGHIRDLDPKNLSIDIDNNFKPHYVINDDKKKVVTTLLYYKHKCDEVIIASDLDLEGQFIALSIKEVLHLQTYKRIIFNQITKNAILDAISKPTLIHMPSCDAQCARRIVDRLMGYILSPLLQKYLQGGTSAGRTQSVAVRIIIDKEKEVNDSIQNIIDKPFFKSTSDFKYNDINISAVLIKNKENYKIDSKESALNILNQLNKTIVCKVISANIAETQRHPSPPHTTATIMQEASSKLGMKTKTILDTLQKLYENSWISYHRTDSTSLSKEFIGMTKEYIYKTYGEKYYKYREYKDKGEHTQQAHEAIRNINPVEIIEGENITNDMQRVYHLIWQRATASIMSNAIIDVQTINIDILSGGSNKTILPDESIYQSTFQEVKFDGFLIVYGKTNKSTDSEEEEHKKGLLDIKKDVIINHINTDIMQTFTTPKLRYNEAGLIKYLKSSGVGRPSTYSAIITKILERNYVEIKNIEGIEKDVITLSVSNKKYNSIKEKSKKVKIGAEKQKMIPIELGYKTNEFLVKYFDNIINVDFTSDLETKLDLIENEKIKWYNVIKEFYDAFNPIVIKLNQDAPQKALGAAYSANDKCLGEHNDKMIYLTKSKFGWCVKSISKVDITVEGKVKGKDDSKTESYKFGSIGDMEPESVSLEDAIGFLEYPKDIGKIGSSTVVLNKGKFGFYFKIASKLVGIKDKEYDPTDKTDDELLELAKELNENSDSLASSNSYLIGKTKVFVKTGEHGPYIMVPHGSSGARKPTFISIPKGTDHTKLTAAKIKELMDNHYKKEKQWTKK